jgi:TonB family protein
VQADATASAHDDVKATVDATVQATPQTTPQIPGGTMAGNRLTEVQPVYPPDAKAAGIEGTVILSAVIGKDGKIENLQVVSGPAELTRSALDAVRQWTYRPYLVNGDPVAVETTITVNYSLQK